jgi:hypothetical protein
MILIVASSGDVRGDYGFKLLPFSSAIPLADNVATDVFTLDPGSSSQAFSWDPVRLVILLSLMF